MARRQPVKGMLTGPITILQWSFVRNDQPRSETARGPRLRSPKGATGPTHKVGRPPGASSPLVHVRLPRSWCAQLERSLERRASQTGGKATRGMMARRALERVRARDEAVGPPRLSSPPLRERDAFHRASLCASDQPA